jgi:hypothetical protein
MALIVYDLRASSSSLEVDDSSKNRTRWLPPGQMPNGLLDGYFWNQREALPTDFQAWMTRISPRL